MNARIRKFVEKTLAGDIYPEPQKIETDEFDENLPEPVLQAKRLTDYMLAQPVLIHEESELTGLIRFNACPVPSNLFPRMGFKAFDTARIRYYNKPQENLCIFEWQHSNPDIGKVIRIGLRGLIGEINASRMKHLGELDHLNFLTGLEMFIQGLAKRADQCRAACVERAEKTEDPARKATLRRMARNLERVPMEPAESFEEAIQSLLFVWLCLSDSIGRPDQYLLSLYRKDTASGKLTRDHAKELLQELFCIIHRWTPCTSSNDTKGAESHFVVGGYTLDHEDGFNELSELIVESMMEMPLIRPQVSLRWTKKTPFAVLKKMMDHERKDPNKRIAFASDEPRIRSLMEINKLSWEDAHDYIVVGCNEPAFQGGISLGGNTTNILRAMTDVFAKRRTEVLECTSFDEFYALFAKVLKQNLEDCLNWSNRFNALRSGDCSVMSSLFLDGCIERAESATRGGARLARSGFNFMGGTNLIDSLCIIRQFVFDEKRIDLKTLAEALDRNWEGCENLRQEILKRGRFFGNNEEFSNGMARRLDQTLYDFGMGRKEHFGNQLVFGNLTGYWEHFAQFGALTGATPDGRLAGSPLTFGSGQEMGKERDGATSHLLAVAQMDPTGIMAGNTIMNITMERAVVENEESFDKFVHLVETYFQAGGLHLQMNYVSREELLAAKKDPENYRRLRVRVSGFSAYFTGLHEEIQDNVIARTVNKG